MVTNITPYWGPSKPSHSHETSIQGSTNVSANQQTSDSSGSGFSQSYIPEYSQTPILESIAKQAQAMAPEVYQWGMGEYNRNQGNIDAMMRNAMTYASPQRIAASMGQAQAGVAQGAAAGLESAKKDLQSYGIDPSSGRYAGLDQASRVMAGAQAAGAGNVQRDRDIATGWGMETGAQGLSEQNYQTGYGAANAAGNMLGVASQLKYSPLGTMSANQNASTGQSSGASMGGTTGVSTKESTGEYRYAEGGDVLDGGAAADEATQGGFVSTELSPSSGAQVDDVQARLNAGEFVVPKDVAGFKGTEFFYKLMAQARKLRAMYESGQDPASEASTGYATN